MALSAVVLLLVLAGPGWGHSFEVEHRPGQGARLDRPPEEVVLQVSEAVVADTAEVTVRLASQQPVRTAPLRLEADGRVLRAALLDPVDTGIYLVAWHVVSAVDGHETVGEYAFAVGEVEGVFPGAREDTGSLPIWQAASSWLLFTGLSLGAGGLLVLRFLPLAEADRQFVVRLVRLGLTAAIVGAGGYAVATQAAGAAREGVAGVGAASLLPAVTAVVLTVALGAMWLRNTPGPALLTVLAAAGVWSARSHGAAYAGAAGGVVDFVHLAAAAGWVGSLSVVAAVLWRAGEVGGRERLSLIRGYARVALPLVIVVAATGVLSATQLLERASELLVTGYGRLLSTKVAVVAVALALALFARLGGPAAGRHRQLRGVTASEAGALAVVLGLTAALSNTGPPVGGAEAQVLLGPPPLEEPVARTAGLAGSLTISLTAGGDQLQVEVFGPAGRIDGAQIAATARTPGGRGLDLRPRSCGAGCFTQQLALSEGVTTVAVNAETPDGRGGRFEGRLVWPPDPTDPQLLRDLVEAMREVSELQLVERVSSGPGATGETVATLSGERFLEVMPYGAGDAVGVRRVAGEADTIEFFMPAARMWFTVWLDGRGRVREQRFVNPGHEIRHTVRYPDTLSG